MAANENTAGSRGKICPHIVKSVNLNAVKKLLKGEITLGECQACSKNTDESVNDEEEIEPSIWLCLQCGSQGCGRYSKFQHALQHHRAPHSDQHSLVINMTAWDVWCYDCDVEVVPESSKKLLECVNFVRKQACRNKSPRKMSPDSTSKDIVNDKVKSECDLPRITGEPSKEELKEKKNQQDSSRRSSSNKREIILPRVKGLSNLGNTCFFNAIMQNLNQTHWLTQLIDRHCPSGVTINLPATKRDGPECDSESEEHQFDSIDIVLPESGPLTSALGSFFKEMQLPTKNGVVSPNGIFGQICKKAPQFRGSKQQDSHELLRHLLDGLRTEEIKRQKSGILRAFNLTEKVDPKIVDEEVKRKVKAYGRLVNHTIVDSIFSGQLISTVLCKECQMSSQVFEPFLDLSLPISEEKPLRPGTHKKPSGDDLYVEEEEHKPKNDAPNKYQAKKAKKAARREAKRNKRKGSINKEEKKVSDIIGDFESLSLKITDGDTESLIQATDSGSDQTDADVEDNEESENTAVVAKANKRNESKVTKPDVLDVTEDKKPSLNECDKEGGTEEETFTESRSETTEVEMQSPVLSETLIPLTPDTKMSSSVEFKDNRNDTADNANTVTQNDAGISGVNDSEGSNLRDEVAKTGDEGDLAEPREKEASASFKSSDEKNQWSKQQRTRFKEDWIAKSSKPLASRCVAQSHECSVLSCLKQFTAPELLMGNNKFGCENCTKLRQEKLGSKGEGKKTELVYSHASKQLLIFSPPAVLTLHLKRFQQVGYTLRKVNRHVEFPMLLDLAPFCSTICLGLPNMKKGQSQILYSLYGVVQHSGRLNGGHYIAYVKVRPKSEENEIFLNRKPAGQYEINRLVSEMAKKTVVHVGGPDSPCPGIGEVNDEEIDIPRGKWYCISDSHVSEVSESAVLKSQAYVLFYERIL